MEKIAVSEYLPTDYQKYYVYVHRDPNTGGVVYIGMGQGSRAWMMRNSGGDRARYGHRREAHYRWFQELEAEGYTLADIVEIVQSGLSKSDALALEEQLIAKEGYTNLFNVSPEDRAGLSLIPELIQDARAWREEGLTYKEIGIVLGVSTMTIHRALNGQTKGYLNV